MTNDIASSTGKENKQPIPYGTRLKTAREALGLDSKEAAAQLRLNEKIIHMLEKDRFPTEIPTTFVRGYMRSYGKLLQIPDLEIKKAVEMVKQRPSAHRSLPILNQVADSRVTSGNYFMQFFTYLILFTLLGLASMWWFTHNSNPQTNENTNPTGSEANLNPNLAPPLTSSPQVVNSPVKENAGTASKAIPENDSEKLTDRANNGIIPSASVVSNDANNEEELESSTDQINENNNDD